MLKGKYEPGPVIDATLRIFVDGVERPHLSASWEGNTSGGLPSSLVAAGDGVYSRTGSITWAPESAVTRHPLAPVGEDRWMPTPGAHVRIVAVVGEVEFPRFWGYLGASTYRVASDVVTTAISDDLQGSLQGQITIPPVWDPTTYSRSGWVAWRAIEQAGYGVLPPVNEDTVLHNGHQFGLHAAVGKTISTGVQHGEVGGYTSASNQSTAATMAERAGRDIMIYARAGDEKEDASWTAQMADGSIVTMKWSSASHMVSMWTSRDGRVFEKAVDKVHDGSPLLCAKLSAAGIRVWTDPDTSVLYPSAEFPSGVRLSNITAGRTAGIMADYLSNWEDGQRRVAMMGRPLPRLQLSNLEQVRIPAMRGFENVTCEHVISEWAAATLSTVWIDEEGRLNMAARDRLATHRPEIIDKISERVFGGAWKTGRDGVRSGVVVDGLVANAQGAGDVANAVVWQPGNIQEVEPNKDLELFAEWPENVDVHNLDMAFRPVVKARDGIFAWDDFNKGAGSWWAVSFENEGEPEGYRWTGAEHETLTGKLERLGQRAVKMTFRVQKKTRGGPEKYYLCSPSIAVGSLRFGNRGVPMPILRCGTLVTWTKFHLKQTSGAYPGAVFNLDSGWWLHPNDAARVARSLAAEIGTERVTFDALDMLWDPRKQIGDSIVLQAQDEGGAATWEVECLVTGYRETWRGKVPAVALDLSAKRITDMRAGKTYQDMRSAYSDYGSIPGNKTYNEVYSRLPGKVV